ncbi:MAG TPA: hypothetical protein VG347_20925, partial [Verrucomicrobiae bacterium]|nr:hypothetical protein [Verrucomicrobiae bacterium]
MNITILLAGACAVLAVAMSFLVLRNNLRSPAHLSFVVGVALLAAEAILNGLSLRSDSMESLVVWQHWRLLVTSFLPGVWLFFSL